MNAIISVLVAAAIIASLIAIRLAVVQSAVRTRLKLNPEDSNCQSKKCFGRCGTDEDGREAALVSSNREPRRSAPNAS